MELNDDTLSSMTDKLIEEKAVEQYVELGKLAQQLIPLFNVMQSDLDNQEDYYIQIGNLILEYYGENIKKLEKPLKCSVFNMYVGAAPEISDFYTFSDLPVMISNGTLMELTSRCEIILTLVMAYFHKCILDPENMQKYHYTTIEFITRGVIKELCLHKFLMTESSDDEKLVILTDWILNKVVGILAIMHSYVRKTFKDGFLPLFAITGEDNEENENLKKYGILIFNYKK
jgi:hypothetical protein